MSTVKVDKDVFIRDRFNVRIRAFAAGTEVDQEAYDKAVNPQDHPTSTGVYIPKSMTKDGEAMENKMLPEDAKQTEVVGAPAEELEAQKDGEEKKKPAKADAKANK